MKEKIRRNSVLKTAHHNIAVAVVVKMIMNNKLTGN